MLVEADVLEVDVDYVLWLQLSGFVLLHKKIHTAYLLSIQIKNVEVLKLLLV